MADQSGKVDTPPDGEKVFLRRLMIVTFALLLIVLLIYFLREFRAFLQPLFVAVFVSYVVLPAHHFLVRRGLSSLFAYILLLALLLGCLIGLGTLLYNNLQQLIARLPFYEERFQQLIDELLTTVGVHGQERREAIHDLFRINNASTEETVGQIRSWLGSFLDFFSALAVTAVYFIFVIAERASFTRRIAAALTPGNAERVLRIAVNINEAISGYLAVKTFVSFLGGLFTVLILALFRIDFFITWGILAFLFNFIPYLGSLVATVVPIFLALVQLGWWPAIFVAVLLIAMQQAIGVLIEPRMAGQRLNVSPLLILLSLSFWGLVWGIVGMILAVPLLVIIKIVLDNIEETRPIAALMVNVDAKAEG